MARRLTDAWPPGPRRRVVLVDDNELTIGAFAKSLRQQAEIEVIDCLCHNRAHLGRSMVRGRLGIIDAADADPRLPRSGSGPKLSS